MAGGLQAHCSQRGRRPSRGRQQPRSASSTAAPLGTAPGHPEAPRLPSTRAQARRKREQSPKGHTKDVPYGLALFYPVKITHLPCVNAAFTSPHCSFSFISHTSTSSRSVQRDKSGPTPLSVWDCSYPRCLVTPI